MFSFCCRLNQCKFGPSILFFHGVIFFHSFCPFFAFFKFAKWTEVCRTRKSSRKRITRTSLGSRRFDTVFQRPYRYFSIALKVFFSLSNRYKISHYHYHYYNYYHHHHQSPDNGSELLASEEESEESDTVLDKEGNSENDLVIADLEQQSIMTRHTGTSTVSTLQCLYIVLPDDNIQSKSIINNINNSQ